jgi:hypothetical protein
MKITLVIKMNKKPLKTVLCKYYYNRGKCYYDDKCTYEHDKQNLIDMSDNKYKYIYCSYIINDDIKIILANLKNYDIIIKKNNDEIIQFIILIALITLITQQYNLHKYELYNNKNIEILNKLLSSYLNEIKDINYTISICIILCIPSGCFMTFLENNFIYNKMFRGLLLSQKLKMKYITKLLCYITLNKDHTNRYNYICYLNENILKNTYNNNKEKIYDIHRMYNIITKNIILQYQMKRNICNDKQLITQIVEHIKDDHRPRYYNNLFINYILSNINDDILNENEYMSNLISNNIFISQYIDINRYITNISLIKSILSYDINKYNMITDNNKSLKIILIGCNVNISKIPYNDILRAYTEYIYKFINEFIGEIDYIYTTISEYVVDIKNFNKQEKLRKTRMNILFT